MTETYRGQADVARWCGVSTSAISNWMRRHEGLYPEPDIEVVNVESGADDGTVIRGWKPERRPEWEKYAQENKRGRNTVAKRRAVKTAERIREMVEAGSIEPAEAVKLLVSLVGDKDL